MEPLEPLAMRPARTRAPFPSLLIRADGFEPRGAFAAAQASFLEPDPALVAELDGLLQREQVGVVAHFYMDAELQGVLSACSSPHVHIADSLQMAERAVRMAEQGARAIAVLGVDFMSENVRATLDASGFPHVPVYRVAEQAIGCSLAEAAEAPAYGAYLTRAAQTPRSLHVIYVNTSLRVKARAQRIVPTITCTSSNVVPMILQAFAQVPDLHVWFGPDTYMGHNLTNMLARLATLDAASIARLHPAHTPDTLASAARRFACFEQGACVVHHMFGRAVVDQLARDYADALITAHLEVPGEMFALGFEAQRAGRGVVGSTSNILDFIGAQLERALAHDGGSSGEAARKPLRFVLGTESGMITSIARRVRERLQRAQAEGGRQLAVEIVFPVAAEAVAQTGQEDLPLIPGLLAGEGCSVEGGCASCPYMKMNSLDALLDLLRKLPSASPELLLRYAPKTYSERIDGASVAELGTKSIVRMRELQRSDKLPDELVAEITAPHGRAH
jgi:quinolinate synthase